MCFKNSRKELAFLILLAISTHAISAKTVNVLTWWGYLNHPQIKNYIYKKCHVNLSHDEYFTNDEFLRRFSDNKQNYDVIIFSNTIYSEVKNKIANVSSPLGAISKKYNATIKEHYINSNYPSNIGYFMLSLSGFFYNPDVVNLKRTDSIQEIFKKADKKVVILMDDPVEIWNLINRGFNDKVFTWNSHYSNSLPLSLTNYKRLALHSNVYISNNLNKLYNSQLFAFSFMWTGDAIIDLERTGISKMKFLVHPKLSYISTDLIANLNEKKDTKCVVGALDSKPILDIIEEKDFYFSPYGDYQIVNDSTYRSIYSKMYHDLNTLPWLVPVSKNEYSKIKNDWYNIQLQESSQ